MATKSICLYFQVHQPTRLRLYRFFDIGKDSHYYDDFANRTILRRIAQKCYLPMNQLMLELIKQNKGKFKIAYSISGSALEQFQRFAPDVIESFKALAATGKVEFLAETYYHSLASLASESEFRHQVAKHAAKIEELFGVKPTAFRNTELIYSNGIGEMVYDMGYKTMLTEGARHIMGWKSPNYVYTGETQPKLKLLLRNYGLSDDIAFRFAQQPVTAEQFVEKMKENAQEGDIVNLFMDYETFGEHQGVETGIFDFMKALPAAVIKDGTFGFVTPTEATKKVKPVADISVEDPISWADEERDLTAWLGNELQNEAYKKVYAMTEKLSIVNDVELWEDFGHLQESDHFYYMCTKFFSDGEVHKYFNPYDTPYEAFINYMNVISDFQIRLDEKRAALDVKETVAEELGKSKRKKK
ncbi:MAG: glycoside hydrolase family 57 protein [Bacteroidales bacterium]|nr:glycoside hydrolase family 57 protein [Bacteroidales bacterium]